MLELGRIAIPVLVLWMRDGNVDQQVIATYALRELCEDAWAVGYEPDIYYQIFVEGHTVTVRPQTRQISIVRGGNTNIHKMDIRNKTRGLSAPHKKSDPSPDDADCLDILHEIAAGGA